MRCENWFPTDYSVGVDPEFPGRGALSSVYSNDDVYEAGSGTFTRIQDATGQFWHVFVPDGGGGLSIVTTTPMRNRCLISSHGHGVLASTDVPADIVEVDLYPLVGVLPVADLNLMLIWSFDSLRCLSPMGIAWIIDDLVIDQLNVDLGQGGVLHVTGWAGADVEFAIDALSGEMVVN